MIIPSSSVYGKYELINPSIKHYVDGLPSGMSVLDLKENGTFSSVGWVNGRFEVLHKLGSTKLKFITDDESDMAIEVFIYRRYFVGQVVIEVISDLDKYYQKIN